MSQTTPNPASAYRYLTTNLISGEVASDWLPLTMQNFSRAISASATFTGALNLTAGSTAEARAWIAGIEPRRSVMWVLLDGVPVWNGIIWDWPHMSALDGTLPVTATTMDSLFTHRLITDDLSFANADVFDVFRGLIVYAISKAPNGNVANLNLGTVESGITDTISYVGADMAQVASALSDLTTTYGFEYTFRPGFDNNGNLTTYLDLGYPQLGQQYPASGLAYSIPGNLLDYRWPRTGSSSSNTVYATAQDSTGTGVLWQSAYPHGYDLTDLGLGYPLLEESVSLPTVAVIGQDIINSYADGVIPTVTGTQLQPLLTLGNGQGPSVKDITLGSWCQLALTSPLHPAMSDGSPGYQGQARITGWTLYPPSTSQAEYTWIQTYVPDTP